MGVSYTKVYQDSTTQPSETATSNFDISNSLPAGMIEKVGIRYTTTGIMSAASVFELLQQVRLTVNGDQVINFNSLIADNTSTTISRIGAFAQDIGGQVDESGASGSPDGIIWLPLGINVPNNSRFELHVGWGVANAAPASSTFEVWCKYGASANTTIIGNMTSETPAANAQTMVSVKIPNYKGATVAGIAIQGLTAAANLTSVIVKPLGDFAMNPTTLQGAAVSGNGYYFYDASAATSDYQTCKGLNGYYFVPLYNLTVDNGSVVLLITASVAENYTFTPILTLPTSGNGESKPVQTASVKSGSSKAILSRAED